VDNRNWELGDHVAVIRKLSQSRAIALDMESATIAANGFRFLLRSHVQMAREAGIEPALTRFWRPPLYG
jgi:hypothetical protein